MPDYSILHTRLSVAPVPASSVLSTNVHKAELLAVQTYAANPSSITIIIRTLLLDHCKGILKS